MKNFDIAIIGGSFAGMSCALALAKISSNLQIAIIEKQDLSQEKQSDGRGYAISNASLDLFREIEIENEILEKAGAIENINITDQESPVLLSFLKKENNNKNFGALIESYIIHNALRKKILEKKNITIFSQNEYEEISFLEKEVLIVLKNKEEISVKLLLACDGRFSKLREKFNIHTISKDYNQKAIVFNVSHEESHKNIAWEKFFSDGPLAILPLKNPCESSIVWISSNQNADAILSLDDENFYHQLSKKFEKSLGNFKIISKKYCYPLIMIEAQKFYHDKMLLVGDAACGVHPIAGQGLNLGLGGIKILQKLIAEYINCGLEISSFSLIESYHKKASFEARKMLIATDILNSIFKSKCYSLSVLRKAGVALVNKSHFIKKIFIKNSGGSF